MDIKQIAVLTGFIVGGVGVLIGFFTGWIEVTSITVEAEYQGWGDIRPEAIQEAPVPSSSNSVANSADTGQTKLP